MATTNWSDFDRSELKKADRTASQYAADLGKTKYSVNVMANILGITLPKQIRQRGGDIFYNGSPCLMFMSLEQICRVGKKKVC